MTEERRWVNADASMPRFTEVRSTRREVRKRWLLWERELRTRPPRLYSEAEGGLTSARTRGVDMLSMERMEFAKTSHQMGNRVHFFSLGEAMKFHVFKHFDELFIHLSIYLHARGKKLK